MFKLTPFNTQPRRSRELTDFDNFIEDFFNTPLRSLRHDSFKIDVEDTGEAYEIKADVPGISKDEIKVTYDDQVLNIAIEKREENDDKDEEKNYLHRERRYASMQRSLHLPEVDPSNLKAKVDNGVLHIHAKKSEVQNQGYVVEVE